MSHLRVVGQYDWIVYREDVRPEFSHLYHDVCKQRPGYGSGEYFSCHGCDNDIILACDYCGAPVPGEAIIALYNIQCGPADSWDADVGI